MLNFLFAFFSQDFRDFESSYLWNGSRYQQTVKSFLFGFQRSFILVIKKSSKILMHRHFKLECSNGVSGPLLVMICSYLSNRVQRVVINGKMSKWTAVTAGVPQGSVLGPLFFLTYINDLVDNLSSEAKLFADDTSLFSVVYDESISAEKLDKDLEAVSKWTHQWKMQFNPDKNKQAVQVIFSHRSPKPPHPPL